MFRYRSPGFLYFAHAEVGVAEIDFYVTLSQEHAKEILSAMAALMASSSASAAAPTAGAGNAGAQRHARNGSGDAQLVDSSPAGGMQRAQSTGSLSDACGR